MLLRGAARRYCEEVQWEVQWEGDVLVRLYVGGGAVLVRSGFICSPLTSFFNTNKKNKLDPTLPSPPRHHDCFMTNQACACCHMVKTTECRGARLVLLEYDASTRQWLCSDCLNCSRRTHTRNGRVSLPTVPESTRTSPTTVLQPRLDSKRVSTAAKRS